MKLFIFLILILLILQIKNNDILRIPFQTLSKQSNFPSDIQSYILSLIKNDIYVSLEIGSPPQKITSFLKLEEFPFFISGKDIPNSQYDEKLSTTFKSEKYPNAFLEGQEQIKWGLLSNDTFNLISNNKSIQIERINFILASETRTDSTSNIGLMIPDYYSSIPDISFIYQLKKQKIINDYNFMINYTNSEKGTGELIIGGFPHSFIKSKYDQKFFRSTYAIEKPKYMMYGLNFDEILLGENEDKLPGVKQCKFVSDFGLIVGSVNYYEIINEIFFKKKISEKRCFKGNISTTIEWREGEKNYEYFYCYKNLLKKEDIETIPKIQFIHKELNYTFEFNSQELFYDKKEFYIFKIIFNKKGNFYWIFGKPWLSKYLMIFNQDSKTIGYYCYITNKSEEKKKNNKNNLILMGIICFLTIIVIIFGLWLVYFYKKGRKKRINEIKEEFDYGLDNNDKTNNFFNKDLGIDN